jgi:phage tail sheath protein FI
MASTYIVPGIYIEEVSTGPKPISAVSTTTCAFLAKAPIKNAFLNVPVACNNFPEFCKKFVPENRSEIRDFALLHAVYGFFFNGGSRCYIVNIGDGTVAGDAGKRTGVHSLDAFDEIALVAAPGASTICEYNALIDHCENMKNRFAILDGPATFDDVTELTTVGIEKPEGGDEPNKKAKKGNRPKSTSFAAVYTPHIIMTCPFTQERVTVAPSGHIAGIYARTDVDRGVHKAPANVGIRACSGLSQRITEGEQGQLNSNYVNCNRYFPGAGIRVWGARTLSNNDPEWRYVNVAQIGWYSNPTVFDCGRPSFEMCQLF